MNLTEVFKDLIPVSLIKDPFTQFGRTHHGQQHLERPPGPKTHMYTQSGTRVCMIKRDKLIWSWGLSPEVCLVFRWIESTWFAPKLQGMLWLHNRPSVLKYMPVFAWAKLAQPSYNAQVQIFQTFQMDAEHEGFKEVRKGLLVLLLNVSNQKTWDNGF